MQSANSLRA